MDPLDALALARALVDIDSTTGREQEAGAWLAGVLRESGYHVVEQDVGGARMNVFAIRRHPVVVLSTHYDCVPPFIPATVRDGALWGRGACDAKGILAAQIAAAERLAADGEERVGLLFVVGEERGSDGAQASAALAGWSRYLVNGEPTDNRLGTATKGVLRLRLRATGRAAHSAYPERGESAIEKLVDAIRALRAIEWPSDPVLGDTTYAVGIIKGGVAHNVIPPLAEAELTIRLVGPASDVVDCLRPLKAFVSVERGLEVPAVRMACVPGFPSAAFAYTTDVPFLAPWGTPLLLGPGSIHHAHTPEEHLPLAELATGVDLYVRLVRDLMEMASRP
jgi:acetylornithine deacetylase